MALREGEFGLAGAAAAAGDGEVRGEWFPSPGRRTGSPFGGSDAVVEPPGDRER